MIEEVIKIRTDESAKSVKELRAELKELKDQMVSSAQGSEEYNKALIKAANIQKELKDQMFEINNSAMDFGQKIGNASKAMAGMTGAISAATGAMSLFGIENEEAAQKITATMTSLMGITQGLQALDSGVKAFKALTIAINASSTAMKGLKAAIAATGIGALVALVATLIVKWNDWVITTKEEAAALAKVGTVLKNLNYDLTDQERLLNYNMEMMKLKGKSEKEVLLYQQQQLINMKNLAQERAREIEQNLQLIKNAEDRKVAEEELQKVLAKVDQYSGQIQQNYLDQSLANQREINKTQEKAKEAAKTAQDNAVKLAAFAKDMAMTKLDSDKQYTQEAYDIQMKYFNTVLGLYKKDSEDYRNALLEKEQFQKQWGDHFTSIIDTFKNSLKTERQKLDDHYKELKDAAQGNAEDLKIIEEWYQKQIIEIDKNANKEKTELLTQFKNDYILTDQEILDNHYNKLIEAAGKDQDLIEQIKNWYVEESQAIIDNASEPNQAILDQWNESFMTQEELDLQRLDEQYTAAIDAAIREGEDTDKIYEQYQKKKNDILNKHEKMRMKMQLKAFQTYGSAVSDLLGNISDMMEEGSAAQKGMATAAATIQMLLGITTALSGAFTMKSGPWDYVLAGIQAAAIAAAGIANIAKIQSVKPDGEGTGGGGSYVSSISIPSAVAGSNDFTQTVDGAMTETAISDQKVYVLENEITDTQKKVEVNEARATY